MAKLIETEKELVLPVPPPTNKRLAIVNGRMRKTSEHRKYVETVHKICLAERITPIEGPVGMVIIWFMKDRRRDIDSIVKTLFDSLTGFAYKDDRQIEEFSVFRTDKDKQNPRVVVKICDLFDE